MSTRASFVFLAVLAAAPACKPSLPARVKETPLPSQSTACADSFLLSLDPDTCEWKRIDGATGREALVTDDTSYCSASGLSVHPSEPRVFAHLMADADTKPDVMRELSVADGILTNVAVPLDVYVEYAGYDERGRMTVIVAEEIAAPGRAMTMVNDLFGRESCAMESARAYVFDGSKWILGHEKVAEMCGDPAPTDELQMSVLAPSTMVGTTTLVTLPRVTDKAALAAVNEAMDAGEETPVWREKATDYGRILRGTSEYGDPIWIAFLDAKGAVLGKPTYEENVKLRLRGKYLLSTLDSEESARLYDVSTGQLVWEAEPYSNTVFWPCAK